MSVSIAALRMHLDYTAWASTRLWELAATLPSQELTRDFGTADRSVLGTLAHIFAADRIWLSRVLGASRDKFVGPEDHDLAFLQREWPLVHAGWKQWAADLPEASVTDHLAYSDLKGNRWQTPCWQIVMHLVNHATHHRGQIAGFLRAMNHKPPNIDLIAFYRALS